MTKRDYIESSGNVFDDLGLAGAEERLAKAKLAQKIGGILRARRVTQVQAAVMLGVDQPKVSALLCGQLARFSIEKLMQFLLLLGQDVSITIQPRRKASHKRSSTDNEGQRVGTGGKGRLTVKQIASAKTHGQRPAA